MDDEPSVFRGAVSEAWGREISKEGIVKGTKAHIKGMLGIPGADEDVSLLRQLVEINEDHTHLLALILEALEPEREESLGRGADFRSGRGLIPTTSSGRILDPRTGKPFVVGAVATDASGTPEEGDGPGVTEATTVGGALGLGYLLKKFGLRGLAARLMTVGGLGTAITLPIVGASMGIKDAIDHWGSKEERWTKSGENIGGMTGTGVGAVIGGMLGIIGGPVGIAIGAGAGSMVGNYIGEFFGKSIDLSLIHI